MLTLCHLVLKVEVDEWIASRILLHILLIEELVIIVVLFLIIVGMNPFTTCRVFSLALSASLRTGWVRLARVQGTEFVEYIESSLIWLCHIEDIDVRLCNTVNPVRHDTCIFSQ